AGKAGRGDRGDEKESDEVRGAPLLFERGTHQIQDEQGEEEEDVLRNERPSLSRPRELIGEHAPELSAQKRGAVEREKARELPGILILEKEEHDVQEQEDVDGVEVFASSAKHLGAQ